MMSRLGQIYLSPVGIEWGGVLWVCPLFIQVCYGYAVGVCSLLWEVPSLVKVRRTEVVPSFMLKVH